MSWQELAACRGYDPEAFALPLTVVGVAQAKAVCARCPVRAACLADASATDPAGWTIRGGETPDERRAARGSRAVGA